MSDETQGAAEAVTEVTTPAPEAVVETAEAQTGDEAAAETEDGQGDKPKPKKTAQERFDELTREKHEARREADQLRRDADYWREQAQRRETPKPPETAATKPPGEPDPAKYEEGQYDPRYIEDLTSWKADQAVEKRMAAREAETRAQTVQR